MITKLINRSILILFVFTVAAFAQKKTFVQQAVQEKISGEESYPVDARPLLEDFDKANGIDYEKAGKPVRLNKTTAWNFSVGSTKSWMVSDLRNGAGTPYYPMPSTCRAVGVNCYIFVADSVWNTRVTDTVVTKIKETFDLKTPANSNKGIFWTDIDTFGDPPNFDNDPRIIILLFDIKDAYSVSGTGGYTVGYFHAMNEYPKSLYPYSNEAEIFFMDANPLDWTKTTGLNTGLSTLAHEFQHMIHFTYHTNQQSFFNEGCSLIAEVINGFPLYSQNGYYNSETNHYLLDWRSSDPKVLNDYSRAARFMLYMREQFDPTGSNNMFKRFVQSSRVGIDAFDNDVLPGLSTPRKFADIMVDWWIANYLNDKTVSPGFAKWGYDYPSIPKVTSTSILNPNISYSSDAVYKLGAQYINFTSGKNLKINFNTSVNSNIKIKAFKVGTSSKAVEDVTSGADYYVTDFGTTYSSVTFMVYHNNGNDSQTGPFVYNFTSTGTFVSTIKEIAYDTSEPTGVYDWSVGDTMAVQFDGISGMKLDSIRVALRNTKQMDGGIWRTSSSKFLNSKLGSFSVIGKTAPTTYPVPWNNWASCDVRSLNIDASSNFVVAFPVKGKYTGPTGTFNNVMVTSYKSTSAYHSHTYLISEDASPQTAGWYYISDSDTTIALYLIRAYVSNTLTGTNEVVELLPSSYKLEQNYPNPFNPSTVINYQVPSAGNVQIKIYDMLGREVATLVNEFQQAGQYVKTFHGTSLPSGVYFYTLVAGNKVETKKMILLK